MPSPYSAFVFPALGGVRWWSLLLTAGILVGSWAAVRAARRMGLDTRYALPLLLVLVPVGVIGARAYYVLFEWERRFAGHTEEIVQVWRGGLAWHGALLAGALTLALFGRVAGRSGLRWADAVALGLPLGQAIARWGDYFNQQSFGTPTDLPWALSVSAASRPTAFVAVQTFHPAFLYEALWSLLILALLWAAFVWVRRLRPGDLVALYLGGYSLGRFFIEGIRLDAILIGDGLRLAMLVSAALLGASLLALVLRRAVPRRAARWWPSRAKRRESTQS